ncbi:MAG: hypothetical protein HOP07_10215 [Bacteriovoracaceae bacterium]|nr:hypothetical protein [Bacteriovoracaceae bacterium]
MTLKAMKTNKTFNVVKKIIGKRIPSNSTVQTKAEDISSLILHDHEIIKKLILVLKDSKVGITKKKSAYVQFEEALSTHAKAEEESLYVHMKKLEALIVKSYEGDVEHAIASQLMKEIDSLKNTNDDLWMSKVKVLAEITDHHVKEEEKEVLKDARKEFDLEERVEIGREYTKLISLLRGGQNEKNIQTTKIPKLARGRISKR